MIKRLLFTILLCTVLIVPSGAIQAKNPAGDITTTAAQFEAETSLARFFPQDTFLFVSVRTEVAHLNELGAVASKVLSKVPNAPAQIPPLPTLIQGLLAQSGIDFQAEVLSWLGKWAAFGMGSLKSFLPDGDTPRSPDQMPLLLAVEVTDKAKAEVFMDKFLKLAFPQVTFTKAATEVTTWEATGQPLKVELSGDALLIGTPAAIATSLTRDAKLDNLPKFKGTIGLLTAPAYNILVYVNTPELADLQSLFGSLNSPDVITVLTLSKMGPLVVGATILDGRSLILDMAQAVSKEAQDQFRFSGSKPIDLELTNTLPLGTSLMIQSADLPGIVSTVLGFARAMATTQGINPEIITDGWKRSLEALKASSGVDLEAEIISALGSDFASFVTFVPGELGTSPFLSAVDPRAKMDLSSLNAGFVARINDTAKGEALLKRVVGYLSQAAENNPELVISERDLGGVTVTAVTITAPSYEAPVEIIVGYSGNTFIISTTGALDVSGQLEDSPAYGEALKYLLPNPTSLWYMEPSGLSLFLDLQASIGVATARIFRNISRNLMSTPVATPESEGAEIDADVAIFKEAQASLRPLAALISSGTISTAASATGDALIRMVLTLGD